MGTTERSFAKAGLFGHFGSKEELQLATFEAAGMDFTQQVVLAAAQREAGLLRLLGLPGGLELYGAAHSAARNRQTRGWHATLASAAQ